MGTRWFAKWKPALAIAPFTISLVISGCEADAPPRAPAELLSSPEARQAGGALFASHCAICHGAGRDGRGERREAMNPPPANLTLPPWSEPANAARTFLAIRHGVPRTAMPSWPMFTEKQIWELVAYITSHEGG